MRCWGLGLLLLSRVVVAATVEEQTVLSAQQVTASGDLKTVSVGPLRAGTCVLTTSAVSGTSPTLDVYLQSVVGGIDDDFCRFIQITGTGSQILRFSTTNGVTSSAAVAVSDRSSGIAAGNCRAGFPGSRLKVSATLGGSATPTVTVTLTCHWVRD